MQIKNAFDKDSLIKMGKGAGIAGLGSFLVYIFQQATGMDLGQATAAVTALGSVLVYLVKIFKTKAWKKLFVSAGLAGIGAVSTYAVDAIPSLNLGHYTQIVTPVLIFLANSVKEYCSGTKLDNQ